MLTLKRLKQIANKEILLADIDDNELVEFCKKANDYYRSGKPIINDSDYDFVFLKELQKRLPSHQLLTTVETDNNAFGDNKVLLPKVMLSTDKAYSIEEIQKWLERLKKSATQINLNFRDINIKVTPKLDGFAAFDDGKILYTRGDGKKGSDISRVFARGLQIFKNGKRGLGSGEIVVKKSYFDKYLNNNFEHSRNFQASIIKEKQLDKFAKDAIEKGAVVFTPFILLPKVIFSANKILTNFNSMVKKMLISVDFDVDGVILEVVAPELKIEMGSNRKFHRWMIAFKENKDKAQVEVIQITPQVGRTGKITPVARLKPTFLSGATIVNVSCYHYNFIKQQKLGKGSVVELIRSGLVIPKITKVLKTANTQIPINCPSCKSTLEWQNDFLVCVNHLKCDEQIIAKIEYFFATLGNNDGFGSATIKKLFDNGITKISQIYKLEPQDFFNFGFGEKTSKNLSAELQKSRLIQIENYRFLAAFGIERLGFGNSENLLKKYHLKDIFSLNSEQIAAINGFADITANAIMFGLQIIKQEFDILFNLGFNLEKTIILATDDNYFMDKKIVFSGAMLKTREQMQKQAKIVGAIVQKNISSVTDFLIIGDRVGLQKIDKAKKLGIKIIKEQEYFDLLKFV